MERAVMDLAGDTAPWVRLKPESKAAALAELVSPDTECDVGRFKKLIKARRRVGGWWVTCALL
jgi:hypothetical protein